MKTLFRATTPVDASPLISFLARSFSASPDTEFLQPDLLHWKLWAEREDYSEPRSYVLERNGEIVAHAGIWPMMLSTSTETVRGCHLFDWASDARVLGSGVALLKHITEMFDFLFAIGGSEMTRKILPAIGFKRVGESWTAGRPLRPLRQAFSHQTRNWKLPVRFARNTLWSLFPVSSDLNGWEITEGFGENGGDLSTSRHPSYAYRSNGFFRYLQACPTGQVSVFQIHQDSQNVGHLALNFLHHQARILGVWLNSPCAEHLRMTYLLAQHAARKTSTAFEVVAGGSTPTSESAAVSAGLKICSRTPVYLSCPKGGLPPLPSEFQIADTDAIFMSAGRPSYWT